MPLFFKRKLNWRKILLASLLFLVISTVVRQIETILTMKYYVMPEYFGIWSKLMMPKAGPPPLEFFVFSLLFTWLTGLVLAYVYEWIKNSLPKTFWLRVLGYTKLIALMMIVFSYLPMYLILNVPSTLLLSWLITGTVIIFLASIEFVKIMK